MPGWGSGSFENEDAQTFLNGLSSQTPEDLKQILARAAGGDLVVGASVLGRRTDPAAAASRAAGRDPST